MKERELLKLSFLISILGIFLLLLISNIIQPKPITNYSELKLNNYVKTSGKITSINNFQDFLVIKLNNNITITCNCKLKANQTILVIGQVTEYKNQLQIQADKLKIMENVS